VNAHAIIRSQYLAALEMLRQAIVQCPEPLWYDEGYRNPFWHIAYHALFYTHLYLQHAGEDFSPWAQHREQYEFLGPVPWPPHNEPAIGAPYSQEEVLAYHAFCLAQIEDVVSALDLDAPSGFSWLPFGKLELQFYNIRHIQHHTGQLCERLRTREGIGVGWVAH
jgi:hypothetical protein